MNFIVGLGIWGNGTHQLAHHNAILPSHSPQFWQELLPLDHPAINFISLNDTFSAQYGTTSTVPPEQYDPLILANWLAPQYNHTAIVPAVDILHTEPFHVASISASLDYISHGGSGLLLTAYPQMEPNFGRRPELASASATDICSELNEYIHVLRGLWDSWEDDAEIRDSTTGRFIDREKLHYLDYHGKFFSVRGPSITPRPPQGHPLIFTPYENTHADFQLTSATLPSDSCSTALVDCEIYLTSPHHQLSDELYHNSASAYFPSVHQVFIGTAAQLIDTINSYYEQGYAGVRFNLGYTEQFLPILIEEFIPALTQWRKQHLGSIAPEPSDVASLQESPYHCTLRAHSGMARPHNQFSS